MTNDVEKSLREKGEWGQPQVTTDWRGRATQGLWWPHYYAAWLDAHPPHTVEGPQPATWCRDHRGRDWWATDTPEFDRSWFRSVGVRPPKRITDRARTYWKDGGGGVQVLAIR